MIRNIELSVFYYVFSVYYITIFTYFKAKKWRDWKSILYKTKLIYKIKLNDFDLWTKQLYLLHIWSEIQVKYNYNTLQCETELTTTATGQNEIRIGGRGGEQELKLEGKVENGNSRVEDLSPSRCSGPPPPQVTQWGGAPPQMLILLVIFLVWLLITFLAIEGVY